MSATRLRDNIQNRKLIQQHYQASKKEVTHFLSLKFVQNQENTMPSTLSSKFVTEKTP